MANIRFEDLPAASGVPTDAAIPIDIGTDVQKATPAQIVDSAIPLASQAEAEAGANNTKRMTPLRTAQAIAALAPGGGGGGSTGSTDWGLFTGLAAQAIPSTEDVIWTKGHTTSGVGGARYAKVVNGVTMNNAMALSHPLFVKVDGNGTYRGLLPDTGWLGLAQAGYSGTGNGQPAFQALINYAKAIGCRQIFCDYASIDLWATTRTSTVGPPDFSGIDQYAQDGERLAISANLHIEGLPGGRTTLNCKGPSGGSVDSQYQTVSGTIWRGSAIAVFGGTAADQDIYNVTEVSFANLIIDGGRTVTMLNPDADLSHKGLRIQDTVVGRVLMHNVEMKNFAGEIYYNAGVGPCEQHLSHCWFHGSNQAALNPSIGPLWAENSKFGDGFQSTECLLAAGGMISDCQFYNGKASFMGGANAGHLYNFGYPNRDTTRHPDWVVLNNVHFDGCDDVATYNYVRGKIYCTDTVVVLDVQTVGSAQSVDLEVHSSIDQSGPTAAVVLIGAPTLTTVIPGASAPNYIAPIADVNIRLFMSRTAYAKANNKWAGSAFYYQGSIDIDTVVLDLVEGHGVFRVADIASSMITAYPRIKCETPTDLHTYSASLPNGVTVSTVSATPHSIAISSPSMGLVNTGAATGTNDVTPALGNYPHGFETTLWYLGGQSGTPTYSFARDGTRLRLNATRLLTKQGHFLKLRYDSQTTRWHEVACHSEEAA